MARPRTLAALLCALSLGALSVGAPSPALAQTAQEKAAARQAAQEGAAAFKDGRFEEAVFLFKKAEELVHAPPHLVYMARALVKLRRLVEAKEAYLSVVREELPADSPPAFQQAQEAAKAELPEVEPRIPVVTIRVFTPDGQPAPAEGLEITLDGKPLKSSFIGIPVPVDPGSHKLKVTAEGLSSGVKVVSVEESERKSVDVQLEKVATTEPDPDVPPVTTDPTEEPMDLTVPAYVTLGVGGGLAIVGGVVMALGFGDSSSADDKFNECAAANGGACPGDDPLAGEITNLDDSAATKKTAGGILLGVGVVGIGAGVTMLIINPASSALQLGPAEVRPNVGLGYLGVDGRF